MSETISVLNMFSPGWRSLECGLADAKIRASDKDLPVVVKIFHNLNIFAVTLQAR